MAALFVWGKSMKPYNVEVFTRRFEMVVNTNVNEVEYKEDYLSSDENSITVFTMPGIEKQDYIRINRDKEEYVGVITEIAYGTDRSKELQMISYKPLMELFNTDILFDVDLQQTGTLEGFIADRIREMFIENDDESQNIRGLSVVTRSETPDWYFHITPKETGGHYNIVNLIDSVIIPAMEKYGILVKPILDIQNQTIRVEIVKNAARGYLIETDLPNVISKQITIKSLSADVNKLVIYDAADYGRKKTYFLHTDLSYDQEDRDRMIPVKCEITSVEEQRTVNEDGVEELSGPSFETLAMNEAYNKFANLAFSNLIELTVMKGDVLVRPEEIEYGQEVRIISGGTEYRSILTGREIGKNVKLIFGTVRLDLTKLLRRN